MNRLTLNNGNCGNVSVTVKEWKFNIVVIGFIKKVDNCLYHDNTFLKNCQSKLDSERFSFQNKCHKVILNNYWYPSVGPSQPKEFVNNNDYCSVKFPQLWISAKCNQIHHLFLLRFIIIVRITTSIMISCHSEYFTLSAHYPVMTIFCDYFCT